jgi:hypothetical protein
MERLACRRKKPGPEQQLAAEAEAAELPSRWRGSQ